MDRFWETKSLHELSHEEWESLCDGCAKCCLIQLEDQDTSELVFTNVACDLLDGNTCRCTDYDNRSERVPECMTLSPENVEHAAEFAPSTCAYRRLVLNEPLPKWHPLESEDVSSTAATGNSVSQKIVYKRDLVSRAQSELTGGSLGAHKDSNVDEKIEGLFDSYLEEHVVDWPNRSVD